MANHEVHVLDDYYLAITLLITIAYQLFFFAIAFSLKFDKLTDFAGGTNFVLLAIITYLLKLLLSPHPSLHYPFLFSYHTTRQPSHHHISPTKININSPSNLICVSIYSLSFSATHHARQIVNSIFILLWGFRLSAFLLFRILKTGKDDRFDQMRDKFLPFLGFWVFQMIWVWTVSLPVTILNSPNVLRYQQPEFGTGRDIAGVVLFVLGFVLESVGDVQKYRFRSEKSNKGKVCDAGFFSWSRHPNYFGEIIMQFCKLCSPSTILTLQQGSKFDS